MEAPKYYFAKLNVDESMTKIEARYNLITRDDKGNTDISMPKRNGDLPIMVEECYAYEKVLRWH